MEPLKPSQPQPLASRDPPGPSISTSAVDDKSTLSRTPEGKTSTQRKPRTTNRPAWDSSPASKPPVKKKEVTPTKPAVKKQSGRAPQAVASPTVKAKVAMNGRRTNPSLKPESTSQDAELPPQVQKSEKETVRESGWNASSSISRETSTSSERPSSAGSGKAVPPAETAATALKHKLEEGWIEPDVASDIMSSDASQDKRGTPDAQGRFRVRSSAEVFHRGMAGQASDKLSAALPTINCRAGDNAAHDVGGAGRSGAGRQARAGKTGCVGCSVM
ncbi:hypothetical protein COCOBI_02-5590 [Coccomyxa sp. Obi]|nr:hypothetical protein COCOBI_02-5590 [Coccomyxa sp. Obi]